MTDPISVLLVDDHALVRRGFRRLLDDDPAIAVVGEAGDGEAAIRLTGRLNPRVVIMDYAMPGTTGLTALRRIVEQWPDVAVLMVSMHSEPHLVRQAIDAGARGYVLKNASSLDLVDLVKRVAGGESVIDPELTRTSPADRPREQRLSARQLEVLRLICSGLSNPEIAVKLGLSVNTVSVHRAGIMKALGVHRTGELVAYAIRHKLVDMPDIGGRHRP